ncbi:hypothetical protein EV426DRAFT_371072 [Tirmania nivea]|nr:hypothetical protein EV426DRAFT_371072 [Tirmania nivea]
METMSPHTMANSPKRELCEVEDVLFNTLTAANSMSPYASASPESSAASVGTQSATPEPTPEKKPVKKRKSWGQELPKPTTNLPPRKRAKTEAEKEQRRIERVLRNRAAAQSSRERKRKEVEALEDVKNDLASQNERLKADNAHLATIVQQAQNQARQLQKEIQSLRAQLEGNGIALKTEITNSPSLDLLLTPTSITNDSFSALSPSDISTPNPMDGTLDPSHLSTPSKSVDIDPFNLTQHTAVMLCPEDLPCQLKTGHFSTEMLIVFHLLVNWILCLTASANTMGPILKMWNHLMVSKQQTLDSETIIPLALNRLSLSLTTRHTTAPRLDTLCPTSALLIDATSSVRKFKTRNVGTGLANGRVDSVDRDGDGFPASICDNPEGYLGDRREESECERWKGMNGKEEDLMGILAGEMRKWSEVGIRVSYNRLGLYLNNRLWLLGQHDFHSGLDK